MEITEVNQKGSGTSWGNHEKPKKSGGIYMDLPFFIWSWNLMEEINQAKDQGEYIYKKNCGVQCDKKQNQEQLKMINGEVEKYIEQCKGDIVEDAIKIRLHMQDLKKNHKKEEEQPLCPLCPLYKIEEDTAEHVLK